MRIFIACVSFFTVALISLWVLFFNVLYPLKYKEEILAAANAYKIEPALIAAVINAESSFDKSKISPKNAIGLMQLLPSTASSLTEGEIDLFNPKVNINLGAKYLSYLIKKFGDVDTALFAYNAGEGNVARWLAAENKTKLTSCPFKETNAYVAKIKRTIPYYRNRI